MGRTHQECRCAVQLAKLCVIQGCHRDIPENCALFGYYAANSGNFTTTRRAQFLAKISCIPHFEIFPYASKLPVNGANQEFLLLNTMCVAVKFFPPKNLVYNFLKDFFFHLTPPPTLQYQLPDVAAAACGSWDPLDSNCLNLELLGHLLIHQTTKFLLRE